MRTIPSHVSVEMHTNLIISPHYDSLLCWLVRCLLRQGVQFGLFFFSNSPVEHSSLVGEQHRATGCASWGGSGCTEEHLWYGLPESGQTRTSTSQWYVCPSRLLQQYVYTTWWFFFPLFHHDSRAASSGDGPHLNVFHKKPILFLSKICLVGQQCWSWITVLSPKLLCPHTHIVRIVNAHTHNPIRSNNRHSFLPPTECGWFLTSHLLMEPTILSCRLSNFQRTEI